MALTSSSICVACGRTRLVPHFPVAGQMGADGLIPTTSAYGVALADIWRCQACGHMPLEPMPSDTILSEAYADAESDDYVGEEAGQRETARGVLERVERWSPRRGAILDLGCWLGFLLAEARDRGWQATGVEPSEFASAYARERLGLNVITGELLEAELPEGAFQAVVMGDVIEHLTDPARALERIGRLLRPGGVLWLGLPDAGSPLARLLGRRWWSVLPTHVQYFTRSSMAELLNGNGFEVLELRTAPKAFTVHYYLDRISGYSPAVGRALATAADRAGVGQKTWAPDFRDRMSVIRARPALIRGPRDRGPSRRRW